MIELNILYNIAKGMECNADIHFPKTTPWVHSRLPNRHLLDKTRNIGGLTSDDSVVKHLFNLLKKTRPSRRSLR